MKSLCLKAALYQPYLEYCDYVWTVDPTYYLSMFDKLQKHLCRTVNSSLAASLKPLGHHRKLLSLLYKNYFGGCSSELAGLLPLRHSCGRSIRLSNRLYDFPVIIPRCCKDVYVNSFFPCTARF